MPKVIKDESGAEVEVFEKSEVDAVTAKAADAEAKVKELEQELNPNWKEARAKIKSLEEDNKVLKEKAGIKDEPKTVGKEEISQIAKQEAEALYLTRYKERVLRQFGEKSEAVSKYFDKLSQGETLTEDMIDKIATDAARAVGVVQTRNPDLGAHFGRSGMRPEFQARVDDEGFGTTQSGRSTAAAMGLTIDSPKKV